MARQESMTLDPTADDGTVVVDGVIDQVFFTNEDTGWTAARVALEPEHGDGGAVRAAGRMPAVQVGDPVRLRGTWVTDPKWGEQLRVTACQTRVPTTAEGVRRYLGAGAIKGVGPSLAERLVGHFGERTLDVILDEPERLREVSGIGGKRAQSIHAAVAGKHGIVRMMSFLQGYGISPSHAAKICKRYGDAAARLVQQNPYRLADEILGIGFLTADRVAAELGVARESPERLRAGLTHVLTRAADEGHLFLPEAELRSRASELLELDETVTGSGLEAAIGDGTLAAERMADPAQERAIFKPRYLKLERELAERLRGLVRQQTEIAGTGSEPARPERQWPRELALLERRLGIELAEAQAEAVRRAWEEKVMVVTGGPGTGKTTIIRGILDLYRRAEVEVLLAAPTGRAAKRMEEATGHAARTIHRLLEFDPQTRRFKRDADQPLECGLVIVDEASMVDVPLAAALMRAVPPEAGLILVGDSDQLPSVGPGRVLEQIIESGRFPVARLSEVFRQAAASQIVVAAHQVNRGQLPQSSPPRRQDAAPEPPATGELFVIETDDADYAQDLIVKLVAERIPRRYGLSAAAEIQVITPMKRGRVGTKQLNQRLQEALNGGGPAVSRGEQEIRVGDKLMQMKNDYTREVFNGDIGVVVTLDAENRALTVNFDGKAVRYDRPALDQLALAYACTVHKSQGSEYPAVVMPLLGEHYLLLQRNLLYTAITRARQLFVLVGSPKALRQAVRNDQIRQRYTRLAERLRG